MSAKKSLFFNENVPWIKKGNSNIDVAQGSFDGTETCEIVGLFILSKLSHIRNANIDLYRDDGLLVTTAPTQQAEKMKKQICEIFKKMGLKITAKSNTKKVDFLDLTFGTYRPYKKNLTIS